MDFVLGHEPKNWTTGPPPPSPASEHSQYTNSSIIVRPGEVLMAPSAAVLSKEAHRSKLLRDVALGVMGFVVWGLLVLAGWLWWYWVRKAKTVAEEQETGQEKAFTRLGKLVTVRGSSQSMFRGAQDQLTHLFKKGSISTKEAGRPKSVDDSIGGETIIENDGEIQISKKKELRVLVLEAYDQEPAPAEPWTPRGTNRRIHDIAEERTES